MQQQMSKAESVHGLEQAPASASASSRILTTKDERGMLKYEADDVMNPLEHQTMADSGGFPPFTSWNTGTSAHR